MYRLDRKYKVPKKRDDKGGNVCIRTGWKPRNLEGMILENEYTKKTSRLVV